MDNNTFEYAVQRILYTWSKLVKRNYFVRVHIQIHVCI